MYTKIGAFIDKLLEENNAEVKHIPDHKDSVVLDLTQDYEIVGVSNEEKTSWRKISQISRHPANGQLMKIKLKTGRSVTTTLSHSHLRRTVNSIVPIEGKDLKLGDRIPVARSIPIVNIRDKYRYCDVEYTLNSNLGWLIGSYLADGNITPNSNNIKIWKIIPEFIEKVQSCLTEINIEHKLGEKQGEYGPAKFVSCTNKSLANLLKDKFGNGSYNKRIPEFVFESNKEFIAGLIAGYFDGDGNVSSDRSMIRVGSRSKQLINDLSLLISFVGIYGSILKERKSSEPEKILYTYCVHKKYAEKFKNNIPLIVREKLNNLNVIVENNNKNRNSLKEEIDMIPELGDTISRCADILKIKDKSSTYGRWKKKSAIGRETLGKYIREFEDLKTEQKLNNNIFDSDMATLKQAYNSNVVWDEIVDIKILDDPKEYVYDFTVPGNDSFMVNNGLLVHNTLNSFHSAGIAAIGSVTQGVPRIKELLSLAKKIKTPQMIIYLTNEYMASREMANKISSYIKYTTLGHIMKNVTVYYEPEPSNKNGFMEKDGVKNVYYTHNPNKNSCQTDINGLPWLMRIELDREKMLEKEVTMLEIKSKFCNAWDKRYADSKNIKKEEKAVLDKITQLAVISNTDNDTVPMIHIRFEMSEYDMTLINQFIEQIVEKFKLKGIPSIADIATTQEERILDFNNEIHELEKKTQYAIYTVGINLTDTRYITGIDPYKTICNDVVAMYETFGIEAAKATLAREIAYAYERAGSSVNYHHLSVLVDIMTVNGHLTSIDRHGMNKSDIDPLTRASFEKTVDQLVTAAVFGEVDHMKGVSSRIIAGMVVKGGTGMCDLVLDTEMLEKSEYTVDIGQKYEKTFIPVNKNNVNEHFVNDEENEDETGIFIPME